MGANVDYSDLVKFSKRIAKLRKDQANLFFQQAARKMAARLLALVIPRTPVGKGTFEMVPKIGKDGNPEVYKRDSKYGKKGTVKMKQQRVTSGGTLRRGWTAKTHAQAEGGNSSDATMYAMSLDVKKIGDQYQIEVINPVEYASYVEYGHRQTPGRYVPAIGKRLKVAWVEGKYFLTISEQELRTVAPQLLIKDLENFLKGAF